MKEAIGTMGICIGKARSLNSNFLHKEALQVNNKMRLMHAWAQKSYAIGYSMNF